MDGKVLNAPALPGGAEGVRFPFKSTKSYSYLNHTPDNAASRHLRRALHFTAKKAATGPYRPLPRKIASQRKAEKEKGGPGGGEKSQAMIDYYYSKRACA